MMLNIENRSILLFCPLPGVRGLGIRVTINKGPMPMSH